jgi:hypothetical protein
VSAHSSLVANNRKRLSLHHFGLGAKIHEQIAIGNTWTRIPLVKATVAKPIRKFPASYEGSLSNIQEFPIGPYPERDES